MLRACVAALLLTLPVLAACDDSGSARPEQAFPAGRLVDANPRALIAVAVSHIDGTPHSEDGRWSAYGEPLSLDAGVEYGVNPESGYPGKSYSVRIVVSDTDALRDTDRRSFTCRSQVDDRCEQTKVDGATLVYSWSPAGEEDPASYQWTVVRKHEVVRVFYDTAEDFTSDPRKLDLKVDADDLRAAALDPAMSLRTTESAIKAGRALKRYYGDEKPPIKPIPIPTSTAELLHTAIYGIGRHPSSTGRSTVTDFGLNALAVHLEFPGTAAYDPFSADVFTAVGRTPLLDPPPCKVGHSEEQVRTHCHGRDKNNFMFWEPAVGRKPGVVWFVTVRFNTGLHRPESSAVRFESTGVTNELFLDYGATVRFRRAVLDRVQILLANVEPARVRVR